MVTMNVALQFGLAVAEFRRITEHFCSDFLLTEAAQEVFRAYNALVAQGALSLSDVHDAVDVVHSIDRCLQYAHDVEVRRRLSSARESAVVFAARTILASTSERATDRRLPNAPAALDAAVNGEVTQ